MLKKDLEVKVKELSQEVMDLQSKLSIKNRTIDNYLKRNIALNTENDRLNNKMYQIEQVILNPIGFPILKKFVTKKLIRRILENEKDVSIT